MISRRIYEQAMNHCMKPWYTDTCTECHDEFLQCLRQFLTQLN